MRVFISWSGERSGQLAQTLKIWLTDVMHALEPWVSSEDIEKGARWSLELARGLQNTSVGIICLTPENLTAPWILFEAGALAKYVEASRVCTYLFQLQPADIDGPLASFQATEANKRDTLRLIKMLNGLLGDQARPNEDLQRAFEKWWPEFDAALNRFQKTKPKASVQRTERDLLEEILNSVRLQERAAATGASVWPPRTLRFEQFLDVNAEDVKSLINDFETTRADGAAHGRDVSEDLVITDGMWVGEWTAEQGQLGSSRGVARVLSTREFLVVLQTDHKPPVGPYLLVARRRDDGIYTGRYVNLGVPLDSTAWIGRPVSDNRINGQWQAGRWDFFRKEEG